MMKKLALAALLSLAATQASASIIGTLHLDFESGGAYNGTLTFNDNYHGLIDTEGYLTGGTKYYNEHFTWTWLEDSPDENPLNYFGPGYVDWLMNGTQGGSYSHYIGITWDETSAAQGHLNIVDTNDTYTHGNLVTADNIVSWSWSTDSTAVPESSGLLLLTLGLAGVAGRRTLRA